MAVFERPVLMNEMMEEHMCVNCDAVVNEENGLCEQCHSLASRLYMTLRAFMQNEGYEAMEDGVDENLVQAMNRLFGQLLEEDMEENYVYTLNPDEFLDDLLDGE